MATKRKPEVDPLDPAYIAAETAGFSRKEEKRFNSRKFLFSVGMWFAGTVAFATGLMTAKEWADFSRWTLTLYLIGNVTESALGYLKK